MSLYAPDGGYIFAEHPHISAPDARLIWSKGLDPSVLTVTAISDHPATREVVDFLQLGTRAIVARDIARQNEYATIIQGKVTLRLDVIAGSIFNGPVTLEHRIIGVSELKAKIRALRHFINLCQTGKMSPWHEPADPRLPRLILALRVLDALDAGASHRTIALVIFADGKNLDWPGPGESTRSYIRRLVTLAKRMQKLGPRGLFTRET